MTRNSLFDLERAPGFDERLRALPDKPGVYIMRDRPGTIIYVGKAISLKNRVRSYFGSLKGQAPKVWRMVGTVYDFEYILTDTELEALILENQLIKQHKPHYNIRLKDDKTYPHIKVTTNEPWPRVIPTRRILEDGARYFGPYPGMGTVRDTLDLLDKLFPFRTCDKEITGNDARPCVEYFIHRCLGPCAGLADKAAYDESISQVVLFLEGRQGAIIKQLRVKMNQASEGLEFERAAVFRDRIRTLERVQEEQKVFSSTRTDEDVIAFAHNDREACVQVFFIRAGKLLGRENYFLENTGEADPGEIMGSFVEQFYQDASYVPARLLLQHDIGDAEIIQSWLRTKRGSKVAIAVPRRGEKRNLVELAAKNATEALEQMRLRYLSDEQKAIGACSELQASLSLPVWPKRIECYDVAHLQGTDTAGAMVVFENGVPNKREYRRFQIRTSANSDVASMREMLTRRFKRTAVEQSRSERVEALERAHRGERDIPSPGGELEALAARELDRPSGVPAPADSHGSDGDQVSANGGRGVPPDQANWGGWAVLPDLVVIDGGKGQLSAALDVLRSLDLLDVPIISLAKREEDVFLPGRSDPVVLARTSEALKLLQRVRDEAHRFSNSYNRKLGSKRATRGKLDQIIGVGPRRKKELMQRFGTVKAISQASVEEIMQVPGMTRSVAERLKESL